MTRIRTYPVDVAALLDSEQAVRIFLKEVRATRDPADIARARDIAVRSSRRRGSHAGQPRRRGT